MVTVTTDLQIIDQPMQYSEVVYRGGMTSWEDDEFGEGNGVLSWHKATCRELLREKCNYPARWVFYPRRKRKVRWNLRGTSRC